MKKSIPEIIGGLLTLLFAYTAMSKLFTFHQFESVLHRSPVISNYSVLLAVLTLAMELVIVLLLLLPQTLRIGLIASVLLLTVFTAYLVFMVLTDSDLPCSCGGVIQQLGWRRHIVFNGFFILLGVAGIYVQRQSKTIINKYDMR
ncbi:MAG TPA: hypothetical protein PKV73_02940 [Agriterribacter sp.]|nr:hypothetical protein [Agriterribacter sp.]